MENQFIPKSGNWVFIKDIIPTEYPVHRFALYYAYPTGEIYFKGENEAHNVDRLYYQKHPYTNKELDDLLYTFKSYDNIKKALLNYKRNSHYEFTDRELLQLDYYGEEKLRKYFPIEQQVKIVTEYGNISIQPNEYNIVTEERLKEYFDHVKSNHAFITYLSKSKQLKGKIADQVFYLRTRGISFTQAIQMCIGQVKTSNLLYLYMHPGYVEHFTKKNSFKNYINSHLQAMRDHKLVDEKKEYLGRVKEISGYKNFRPTYKKE